MHSEDVYNELIRTSEKLRRIADKYAYDKNSLTIQEKQLLKIGLMPYFENLLADIRLSYYFCEEVPSFISKLIEREVKSCKKKDDNN